MCTGQCLLDGCSDAVILVVRRDLPGSIQPVGWHVVRRPARRTGARSCSRRGGCSTRRIPGPRVRERRDHGGMPDLTFSDVTEIKNFLSRTCDDVLGWLPGTGWQPAWQSEAVAAESLPLPPGQRPARSLGAGVPRFAHQPQLVGMPVLPLPRRRLKVHISRSRGCRQHAQAQRMLQVEVVGGSVL
jgi:hypothetical protein